MKIKILIIEDEVSIHKLLSSALGSNDYQIINAYTADEGIRQAASHQPNLILLDLGLPEKSGFEVIKSVREWTEVPIIVISARSDENSKIEALDIGANDFVTKPFSTGELVARIKAFLRGSSNKSSENSEIILEPFKINIAAHIIKKNEATLHLTPTEFKIFLLLIKNYNRVITHKIILNEIWGPGYGSQVQYLRVFMKQLRQKIEEEPSQPKFIITEPGIGYRFKFEEIATPVYEPRE